MAERTFTAGDLVSLPRMNARMAVALGEMIVRVAAMADEDDAASQALASKLLAPLRS